jgi:protoporphyrinogen oxidase
MRVAVVGGGMTGLVLADHLAASGHAVCVLEREAQIGGLATWKDYGPFTWDRFYHVILPTDRHLIGFLRRIGLDERLRWRRTRTGFYVDRRMHSLSSGLEFLRFPALPLTGKLRLAAAILYCARLRDWRPLEQIPVGDWLTRLCGRRTFETLWRPLLLAKLGAHYERVSAVFIWSYIKRMFGARDASTQREQLGYVCGGYRAVLQRIDARVKAAGGTVRTGVRVTGIEADPSSGIVVKVDAAGRERFDKVVFTGPTNVLRAVSSPALFSESGADGASVEYLGVICVVLISRRPIVPFYVVNIADGRVPFTGIIGMSNLVDTGETSGLHLTYLPKYVHSDDPLLGAPDDALIEMFLEGLRLMLPDFDEAGVERLIVNRASRVQPLQVIGYSRLVPTVTTAHPDFYVLNSTQSVANTLNNDEAVRAVEGFLDRHRSDFIAREGAAHPVEGAAHAHA